MSKNAITQLKKLFSQFPSQKYPKGTIILRPGDRSKSVSFVKSGFVRIYTKNGYRETTLNIFRPLFMVSLIQAYTQHPTNFYVETLTPVEIWSADINQFYALIGQDQKLTKQIMSYFFGSVLQILNNQSNIISGDATSKVASVLLQLAFDYGTPKENHIHVPFPATHRIIATLIGLTRETTSVQMSKLQKLGVISTKRSSFVVKNLDKLKSLSQQS